ncbi:class I SAM-dependent methyltransferase [Aliiroseovarius subalbicans]|uniref:class I SAM-dependent methyltransferase n=1 Tax=Aliiroseovarius subalbicans TaxID=2925840 RepID=UPI001F5A219B|nr:class I SAM-dependent methyltransferase [Aliiroseovarius subalbicans]MCI2398013.1 class I SAM-dependent methyltransferase [Aliiroseovarius subalbicans]
MTGWDAKTADWYATNFGDDPSVFAVVLAAAIQDGEDVLDVGCGTGSALRAIAGRAGRLTGIDPTPRMIEIAREHGGGITFQVASAEASLQPDASQDVVLMINVLHHVEDEAAALSEAARVLRPGGRIVLGGERFSLEDVPQGQDYAAALARAGFARATTQDIPEGFVTTAVIPLAQETTPTKGVTEG